MKLKFSLSLALVMLIASFTTFAAKDKKPDPKFHIYLAIGQSNMEGGDRPQPQDTLFSDARLRMMAAVDMPKQNRSMGHWYFAKPPLNRGENNIGIVDFFGRTLIQNMPKSYRVGLINVSVAGAKIELWEKDTYKTYLDSAETWMQNMCKQYDGNPYKRLVEVARIAQKDGVIKGIIMHQGESNTTDKEWPKKVKGIYDNLIKDLNLNPKEVPLLAGELKSAEENGKCASFNTEVLPNLPLTLPNSYIISSQGVKGSKDAYHFVLEGYREFGRRFAVQMLKLKGFKYKAPKTLNASK